MTNELELTRGEILLINRIRKGLTQEEAANIFSISRNDYGALERDKGIPGDIKTPFELRGNEKCLILRRREGQTQRECALELGVTRFWYNQMETGNVPDNTLIQYWETV